MDIQKVLDSVRNIPSTPQILPKLQQAIRDPNSEMTDIVALLKMDASLVAQVVRLSNSVFFGSAIPSQSVEDAVKRLGFNEIFKLVNLIVSQEVLGAPIECYGKEQGQLLSESIFCAVVIEKMALKCKMDPSSLYTAGLLHSLGKVIINQYLISHGLTLYRPSDKHKLTLEEERKMLGFDNTQVAAALLRKWNFPDELVCPIEYQYNPQEAGEHKNRAMLLFAASEAGQALRDKMLANGDFDYTFECKVMEVLNLTEDNVNSGISAAEENLEVMKDLLSSI